MGLWNSPLTIALGLIVIGQYLFRAIRFSYIYLRPSSIGRYRHSSGGQPAWALVTGASDGIGRALVRELAQRGFNVVLHGRNQKKLEGVKDNIAREFPDRSFRIVLADGVVPGFDLLKQVNKLVDDVQDINLTVLINNVGGAPPRQEGENRYDTLDRSSATTIDASLSLNVRFPAQLTAALLPTLLKHQPSLIINIGSMADEGNPWHSMYSGSKSFIMTWSKSLSREMKAEGRDIEVLGIETATVTGVSVIKRPASLFMPDAKTYAAALLDRVGCGQLVINGYWTHGFMRAFLHSLPDWLASILLEQAMRKVILELDGRVVGSHELKKD